MAEGRSRGPARRAFLLVVLLLAATSGPRAGTVTVFGPQILTRTTGAPNVFDFTFAAKNPSLPYTLRIDNDGVASAVITVNGAVVLGPSEFNPGVALIQRAIPLRPSNTLRVELRSKPGSRLTIRILGTDNQPPTITATATPAANAAAWNRTDVQVQFVCSDAETGIATCAPARIVTTEGAGQVITGSATDQAGNTATASTTLNIDKTAPAISGSVQPPPGAAGWINQNATVTFTCADDRSGIASCAPPVIVSDGGGNQIVSGAAIDRAGNTAAANVTVNIDQAPPTIAAVVSPSPNTAGWNSSDVTVTFTCADAISGVAACPAPAIVSTEGANQTISGTARDQAGNAATTSVTVSVDKTAATITAAASPAPNADGWNSGPVVVSFTCNDAGAGVLSCPEPETISGDGVNQTVSRTVTDKAGNVATASMTLNIDTSLPTITATPLPPANAQGWNDANVMVTFTCADAVSGITVCPPPMEVPTEGPNQVVTGTAIDKAGNRASASVTLNIDKTAVSITAAVQPPPNAAGWHSTDVVVTFVCEDVGAGAVACPAPVAVTAEGANQIISRTVTDAAGNRSTASVSLSIDKTAPQVTSALAPPVNSAGWVREAATITFTCVDPGGSGIASCTPPATLGEGAAQPVSASAQDIAGNTATLTVAVSVDTTAPAIAASITPAPNAGGWVGSDATIGFVCSDTLSEIASCPAPIPVTAEGPQTFTGTALDRAGNEATTSVSINVDKTRATITAAVQPAPNAAGWNSSDVIVTFTCHDTGAGVASCPPAVPVTAEGANQSISGSVTDLAGNQSAVTISVSIDKTAPQASATLSPGPNAAGWVDRATTVTFACADPGGSGIASCPPPVAVQEGAAQPIGGTAIDIAGNTATAALIVSVDATAPTIAAAVSPPPNAAGWLQADATVTFTCADAGSGIESCPAPIHVAAQGAGQIVTGAAVDRAGNRSTATLTLNVDSTPAPITTVVTPAANGSGWHATDVVVTFICGEDGSGVVSCPPPVTVSTEGAEQVVTRSVVDRAGNTSQASVTLNIDKTPPAIAAAAAPAPNSAAWNRTDVTVSFVCSDSLSTVGSCPQPVTISSEGAGQTVSGAAQDLAGNTATASLLLNIDTTAPVVAITSPLPGATTLVSPVALGGTAVDALSGIAAATCNGAPAPGAGDVLNCAPALVSGLNTLTLTATDVAGNVATSEVSVTFLPNRTPVANAGGAYSGLIGSPVSFNGSGSTDPDNDPLTYAWSFGDGTTGAGVTPSHVYASAGTFDVVLTVTDTSGATSSAATSAVIAQPNRTPTATANGPYSGLTGVAVAFNGQGFDPDGTALTYSWSFGDGLTGSGAAVSHTYSAANTYTATLTVSDGQLSAVSTASVQIGQSNRAPTATAGGPRSGETGIAVSFDGSGSADADNDALSYAWTFGDGGTSTDAKPAHVYSAAGAFTVTVTVTDTHGASSVATTSATIAVAADHAPPVVTLSGPKEALPGAQVMMSSDATDNIGVTSVTFEINGADPIQILTPPYQRLVTIPEFAAPGTSLTVGVKALDAAGNSSTASASLTIVAEPDTVKPIVTVKVPSQAAPGSVLQVGATASDNAGVATVLLAANGATFATLTAPPFDAAFVIPAGTAVGSSIVFTAQAIDGSDNRATASANVSIVQAADTTAPTVTITAPPTATAGTGITITATAADDTGVASVGFFLDGTRIATVVDPPYLATLSLPSTLPAGTRLHFEARAADFSGLSGVASQDVNIVAAGAGVVTGEVYDDRTGLPVEGASAMLVGADARGVPYTQTASSDVRGRYLMRATEGAGVVHITKPGWSVANRSIDVRPDRAVAIVDARITPTAAGAAIAALAGGTATGANLAFLRIWQREVSASEDPAVAQPAAGGADVRLSIAPGALASDATVTLTPLSRQSLPGLLPPGWTPLAIVDIGPHGLSFATPAALSSPNALKVAAGTPVVFAQWDEQTRAWRAVASSVLATDKGALSGDVTVTGQYAWVVADVVPAAPPAPADGELLEGVAAALIPGAASAVVNPQPKILFYKPGVTSDVRGTVATPNALLSSGTIVRSRIIEAYEFVSQAELHLEPVEQDLVLYQIPGGAAPVMAAGFTVSPSLTFEALSLDKGVITVELRAPEEAVHAMDVIGIDGGRVTGDGGLQLDVRAGGVPLTTPIDVRPIPANELGADVPAGFELTGAAAISFMGTLTSSATWSMPRPAQATDADLFLVARLQELGGKTRFVLTGLGSLASDRLVSETALAGTDATFEGIRLPGRYVFLRAVNPLAFAAGTVTVEGGVAFSGALISTSTIGIVALSQPTGRYIAAVALSDTIVTALDLQKTDLVSRPVVAAAPRQVVPLDLALAARPPTVTSVTPVNGALNVALGDPVVVRFSSPIDPATATLQSVQLTSTAGIVLGTLALTSNNTVATFRAADALQPNVAYTLTLTQAIADAFGRSLPSPFAATFTSLDTIAPPPPPAGTISATIPGADGKTTITATQGTAGAHDTVTVKNLTKKTATPVVLDANGGFRAVVQAVATDKLQLVIKDASGNETVVALPRFREANADGTVSEAIGSEGGRLEGPGGVAIDVPAGAFPAGAVVRFGPVTEAEFPFQLNQAQRQLFQYSGGVRLDFGTSVPTTYLNVSVPTVGGESTSDQWLVTKAVTLGGQSSVSVVDTARVITGRITTSSPPCPGVTGSGVYGFLKSARPLGVVYGPVIVDRTLPPGVFIPFLVGPGLISFPLSPSDLLSPGIDGSLSFNDDPLGLGNYISAAGETAAVFMRAPACLPLLSGKATLTTNRITLAVPTAQLTVADREIEVVNVPRAKTTRYFRPFQPTLSIEGGNADVLVVTAIDASGARRTLTPTRTPRSYVRVLVAASEFTTDDRQITIRNLNSTANFTSGLGGAAVDVEALIEGTVNDSYSAEVTGATGPRPANFGLLPYAYGTGNLVVRGAPGTIDPTAAQIAAYNAVVPVNQQLPITGAVISVVLEIDNGQSSQSHVIADTGDTSRLVGGAFNYAVDGSFNDNYTLHVGYADGKTIDLKIPMLRINMTNPTTGVVVRRVSSPVPPQGEPLLLDLSPPTGATVVTSSARSLLDVDPRLPMTLTFSRALDQPSVDANMVVFSISSTGGLTQVAGQWRLSQGNRVASFVPAGALRLNATYRVALGGVLDLGGQPLGGTSVVVKTFRPRIIGTAALNEAPTGDRVPLGDVSFLRQPGPGGKVATRVIASSANRDGFKVHTIDVTDPRVPVEKGHTAGGSYKRRMTLLPAIAAPNGIDVMYDVQLVPQQTGMSCWAAGAAMVVGWRDRRSVDPKAIADGIQYNYEHGLWGGDTKMFAAWGLVPEPPQTYTVDGFRAMLEQFGPLWVASAVPTTHIRVVYGMIGDGTPQGTIVYLKDPWGPGMTEFALPNAGDETNETFEEFQIKQELLGRAWYGERAAIQQLCDSGAGSQAACEALYDPAEMLLLKECSLGNTAACVTANLPAAAGTLVAHLPHLPDWVPPVETGALKLRLPFPGETLTTECTDHVIAGAAGRKYFKGDLAVTSSWNLDSNYFTFFDVTDPAKPCVIGDKTITANPDRLNTFTRPGTVHVQGSARGVATIHHAQGYAAYMAIAEAGLFAVDIGASLPSVNPGQRQPEGFYAGDFADVIAVRDRVLALSNNYGGDATLEIFDPNLSLITSIVLTSGGGGTKQHRIVYTAGSWVDVNRDGRAADGETFDLAFVAGTGGIIVVDLTNVDAPKVVGRIQAPGILREIAIDDSGRTIFAGGGRGQTASAGGALTPVAGDGFFMIDASNPFAAPVSDPSGRDSRIVFEYGYADGIGGISVDSQRNLVYVASPASNIPAGALDIWAINRTATLAFNRPPIADAGPDAAADQDRLVTLDGSRSSDPDGDDLSFIWTQTAGPPVALIDPALSRPTFVAPSIDGAVLTFQLIVNDGVVDSLPDTVTITIKPKNRLRLRPVIVPLVVVPGSKQLTVTLESANGDPPKDVQADARTTYEWIGGPVAVGGVPLPDFTPVLNALAAKLGVPLQLAQIDVDASGVVHVLTPGIQVIRAHYRDGAVDLDSNLSVVLAGIKLKAITLRPESPLTTLVGAVTGALGSKKNPPMILAADRNAYISDTGVVLLDDVIFELFGPATISLKDLLDAIKPLIETALTEALLLETGPAAPVLAKGFTKLIGLGINYAGTQFLSDVESLAPAIATVTTLPPFQGWVQSHVPGLTSITGTLDLGVLGKADDSVMVWVLPDVTSAKVEPNLTVIEKSSPPTPGPTVRTFAEVNLGQATVQLKGKANTAAELLDRVLPDGLPSWSVRLDKTFVVNVPAPNLRFHLTGSAMPSCGGPDATGEVQCVVDFQNVGLGFHVPNHVLGITNTYAIAKPAIAALGAVEAFDTHIVHQNTSGESALAGHVAITLMGSADDPTARIVVVGDGPVLTKTVDGDTTVQGGALVNFTVTVTNPFATPLLNVQVVDTLYFTARGTTAEAVLQQTSLPVIPTLAPQQTVTIDASRTAFIAPSTPGTMRNEVTAVGSAPASASVVVEVATLHLSPELIIVPNAPATVPLTVTLAHLGGATEDVTRDAQTEYEWIGSSAPRALVDAIYDKINAALVAEGQPPLPVQLADVSIDPATGVLTIRTNGLQLLRATHRGLESNPSVVLAGIKLKSIDLGPLSKLNLIQGALVDLANPPLLLVADVPGNDAPFDTVGQVLLRDARFEILGGPATISTRKLVDAFASVVGSAVTAFTLETGPLAKVFGWGAQMLVTGLIDEAGTQLLDPVTATPNGVATVVNRAAASLPLNPVGRVDAHKSGLSTINGTLDLGDFGKASDNVLTWVLPTLQSVVIEPQVTVINLNHSPPRDPKVRTFGTVTAGNTNTPFALSGKFNDFAQAIDRSLPGGWTGSGLGTFSLATGRVRVNTPVNDFVFALDGTATVTCAQPGAEESGCAVTVTNLTFGFHVPHAPPTSTVTYGTNPSIAGTTLDPNKFDTHILGVSAGRSPLTSAVDMTAVKMGTKDDPDGLVIVVGGTAPVPPPPPIPPIELEKRIHGNVFAVTPGGTIQYEVLVENTTTEQIDDVTVTDTLLFDGVVIQTRTLAIGSIPAGEGRRVILTVIAPSTAGVLENRVETAGVIKKVVVTVRRPVINELVVEPQRDWDDSGAGGNSVPFDDVPGTSVAPSAAVTAADQWIELLTNTGSAAELTNWTLEFIDAPNPPVVVTLTPASLITSAGSPYVLVAAPTAIAPTSIVRLRDTTNAIVDQIDLGAVVALVGPASNVSDEAVARTPDGLDSNSPGDFQRRPASIRKPNP